MHIKDNMFYLTSDILYACKNCCRFDVRARPQVRLSNFFVWEICLSRCSRWPAFAHQGSLYTGPTMGALFSQTAHKGSGASNRARELGTSSTRWLFIVMCVCVGVKLIFIYLFFPHPPTFSSRLVSLLWISTFGCETQVTREPISSWMIWQLAIIGHIVRACA